MSFNINIQLDAETERELVSTCNSFKKSTTDFFRQKRETQRRCYAYVKSQFYGDDLLPKPAAGGQENDAECWRANIFTPISRQLAKVLFSYMKLTLFPNDAEYFRVKGQGSMEAQYEDDLTEGLKHLLQDAQFTEKAGEVIWSLIWAGEAVCYPVINTELKTEWNIELGDDGVPEYTERLLQNSTTIGLEVWDPLSFYPDPFAKTETPYRWGYFSSKAKLDLLDDQYLLNREAIERMTGDTSPQQKKSSMSLNSFNSAANTFDDTETHFDHDFYYFPRLELNKKVYRNMIAAVVDEKTLVAFRPNLVPGGGNPIQWFTWMKDSETNSGTGPLEDVADLQKLYNMMQNYKIETLARIGNAFAVSPSVDMSGFFGAAGGVVITENPGSDIVPLTGSYTEISVLDNTLGLLKAEAQLAAGAQIPFQGSAAGDYRKTATEISLYQENNIGILREVVEHISVPFKMVLQRFLELASKEIREPITIRLDNKNGQASERVVDFSIVQQGRFTVELITANPSISKNAQVQSLLQLMELTRGDASGLQILQPIIEKIAELQGIKDIAFLIEEVKTRYESANQAQQQQEASMGAMQQLPMGGVPQAFAG